MTKFKLASFFFLGLLLSSPAIAKDNANIRLTDVTLMHESRATEYPLDGAVVDDRFVSFQWPLPEYAHTTGAPLDGFEHTVKKVDKSKLHYRIRFGKDKTLAKDAVTIDTKWPMYNPEQTLTPGVWYWQYAYVDEQGKEEWSKIFSVTVGDNPDKFAPLPCRQYAL